MAVTLTIRCPRTSTRSCVRSKRVRTRKGLPARWFKVLLEWDAEDRVWVTHVPALGDLSTHGETRDEALEMTREAITGYLEAAAKEGLPVPSPDTGETWSK